MQKYFMEDDNNYSNHYSNNYSNWIDKMADFHLASTIDSLQSRYSWKKKQFDDKKV